jgi:hypothetical protein
MKNLLELIKKFGNEYVWILMRLIFISIGILYILGVSSGVSASPVPKKLNQSMYDSAETLMTCSSAFRNTWSVYDTVKNEKTGDPILIYDVADIFRVYSIKLYTTVNPDITAEDLEEIEGILNTIFITKLSISERSDIIKECINILNKLNPSK